MFTQLDLLLTHPVDLVITGGAKGADTLAAEWAHAKGYPLRIFLPKWKTHGHAAGPIRNATMLKEGKPDLVIAFPGGKGTQNMKKLAQAKGVFVIELCKSI